jgi:hypothetical protein
MRYLKEGENLDANIIGQSARILRRRGSRDRHRRTRGRLFGAPIYVRHEVVHNKYVVDRLRTIGAMFVDELNEVPDGATVIFSAHGVPRSVQIEAGGASSMCSTRPARW